MASATPLRRTSCPLGLLMEKIWRSDEGDDDEYDKDDDIDRIDDQIGRSRKAALIRKAIFSPRCINPYGRYPADQIVRRISLDLDHILLILTLDYIQIELFLQILLVWVIFSWIANFTTRRLTSTTYSWYWPLIISQLVWVNIFGCFRIILDRTLLILTLQHSSFSKSYWWGWISDI